MLNIKHFCHWMETEVENYPACPDTFIPDMAHAALLVFQSDKCQIAQVHHP